MCRFYGVTNPDFQAKRNLSHLTGVDAPEQGKKVAIRLVSYSILFIFLLEPSLLENIFILIFSFFFGFSEFVHHFVELSQAANRPNMDISVGFSDDDKGNLKVATELLETELAVQFKKIKFVVYDTSDGISCRKQVVESPIKAAQKKRRTQEEQTQQEDNKEGEQTQQEDNQEEEQTQQEDNKEQ